MLASSPFTTTGFTLMWDWGGANGFDVDSGSTQTIYLPNTPTARTGQNTVHMYMYVLLKRLTRVSQFQCLLGFDEVVPVIFETSKFPFIDGQHAGGIVRSKVTLQWTSDEQTCVNVNYNMCYAMYALTTVIVIHQYNYNT